MIEINVIKYLQDLNAFLQPPAQQEMLDDILCNEVPGDYKSFLAISNGAQGSGLLLLGTEAQTIAGGQVEPDIWGATQDAKGKGLIDVTSLALGYLTGNLLITHNEESNNYIVLDKSSGDAVYTYNSLEALVSEWAERTALRLAQ